eukprot:913530-Prorocentrum_lima.AAC.1
MNRLVTSSANSISKSSGGRTTTSVCSGGRKGPSDPSKRPSDPSKSGQKPLEVASPTGRAKA